ncbi:hypothetical protein [Plantactinospora sp. CA-290183]|uniref:hypothetical protein n=1 Tax=Plantactinospora sp. CA-290183 TaxID=3240006 RepID=UPI003D926C3B
MGHIMLAVLVPARATIDTVDNHLDRLVGRRRRALRIDGYRLGGQVTGAWDLTYDPTRDPANHELCSHCQGSQRRNGGVCQTCADAADMGRAPGTVVKWDVATWKRYPGDLVPLRHLYQPSWSFRPHRSPQAWVDGAGVRWLDTELRLHPGNTDTDMPPRLRQVLADLRAGRRDPSGGTSSGQGIPRAGHMTGAPHVVGPARPAALQARATFDVNRWRVAAVDAQG